LPRPPINDVQDSKLHEKPSALKREHPAWILIRPQPTKINADPDPKHWRNLIAGTWRTMAFRAMAYSLSHLIRRVRHLFIFSEILAIKTIEKAGVPHTDLFTRSTVQHE
jgi:hypothetical protein